ncbi:hypothetical protein METHB2_80018 [Candidatus Methylobacter favarea]|uniref:Uncharacterized protein n=1 Tax=Candidatus Methylobacter favarea TaxID=2707345 RepID=A0A8S0WSF5_9GAMM|nr:hypothetical protein METHB2_80018 [Candidatus Methylobacter favarea]
MKPCSIKGEARNLKNRVADLTEQSVLTHAIPYPAHGQWQLSNECPKAGVCVAPSGVPASDPL